MSTPRAVDLVITNQCNLRCHYCYHFEGAGDVARDLPRSQWSRFFEELERHTVLEVGLTGGEPFCRPDLPELLEDLSRHPLRFTLYTNATLIGPSEAAFLAGLRRLRAVQVSLDAAHATGHDACRGAGSFERALRGIRALKKQGLPLSLQVTLHRLNAADLEKTAEFVLEELGLASFQLNSAYDMGTCSRHRQQVCLDLDERRAALTTLEALQRRYPGRLRASAGPLAQLRRWTAMEQARRGGESWSQGGRLSSCGGVFRKLAVRADGAIVPCNQLSGRVLGWIQTDDLRQVWQQSPELERLRRRQETRMQDLPGCSGCPWSDWCSGGCPAGSAEGFGTEDCLRAFLEQGGISIEDLVP